MTELIGRIISTDVQKRQIVITDKDSILHPYNVPESLDIILQKQRAGWYVKITSEGDLVKRIEFAQKPADWKGNTYQKPRNENLIVHQTTYKECCDTVRCLMLCPDGTFDEAEFNRLQDIALARSIKDAKALIEAGEQK